jgi:hypothetical protein
MEDNLFAVKEELCKIKGNLSAIQERVALLEDGLDTHDWNMEGKWLMADLNALMVLLYATTDYCQVVIDGDYFEGE